MTDHKADITKHKGHVRLRGEAGVGRPVYRPEFCDLVVEMAEDMRFPEEWCVEMKVTIPALYKWCNKYPEFNAAVRAAWLILAAKYTRWYISLAATDKGKASTAFHIMTKRFPHIWAQNAEGITQTTYEDRPRDLPDDEGDLIDAKPVDPKDMTDEQLEARVRGYLERAKAADMGNV